MHIRNLKDITIAIILLFLCNAAVDAQHSSWLIRMESGLSPQVNYKSVSFDQPGISLVSRHLGIFQLDFNTEKEKSQVLQELANEKFIIDLFPNMPLETRNSEPNDFFYPDQYSLELIEAERAWQQTTGGFDIEGNEVIIAVLDDGFDLFHEDLIESYWQNPNEISGDGIDNDGNGYVDDSMGINIQNGSSMHAGVKHGTQVSGIIGAKGNNIKGITGINWDARILLISGVSSIGEVIKSMEYLYDLKKAYLDTNGALGANIVVNNFSGGLEFTFPSDFPAWCEAYELLGSVGILSIGAVANNDFDVEIEGDMPTLCESDFLITVTNTDKLDRKVISAAYGINAVDLGAPGEDIISASIGNDYETISGTSASAPHVAGAVGLLASLPCPELTELGFNNPSQFGRLIKSAILNGADSITGLESTVSGGRLNIFKAMLQMRGFCGTPQEGNLSIELRPNFVNKSSPPSYLIINYMSELIEAHQLSIFDIRGRQYYSESFSPPLFENGSILIDYSNLNLPSGMYFFQISNSAESKSEKFIVVD